MTSNYQQKFVVADPGATGGVAIMQYDGRLVDVIDMPWISGKNAIGKKAYLDCKALRDFIDPHDCTIGVIEDVWGQKNDGKPAVFSFGWTSGALTSTIAECLGNEGAITYIPPRRWMSAVKFKTRKKGDKKPSIEIACNIYGEDRFKGPRGGMKDGRTDAVMLGLAAIKLGVVK